MLQLGSVTLMTLCPVALFGIIASFVGGAKRRMGLVRAGERSLLVSFLLLTLAIAILVFQFYTDDFNSSYVAGHSNIDLSPFYKATSLWSGQEGSLLFWNWLLGVYGATVLLVHRKKNRDLMPYVTGIILTAILFFAILNGIVSSPFVPLVSEHGGTTVPFAPQDGRGLNPLLQHPAMAIHPPMLYLGLVGFVVPFAFAMAALLVRSPGSRWIRTTRRWTLFAWCFLSCGVLLGARWAYVELGWGGYWAWDPVENASLMPWLTGTAFLHSVMIQEKKGMMKVWNVALVIATYFLCLFGTFLTRSGVVSSVHAFAQSPIGFYFITFIAIGLALSIWLAYSRREFLAPESGLDSVVSRESSFLFNNLILLAACFAVFWGTIFPVISEAFRGEKISVGPPFFNKINIPIGLFLLFLTGVGPLLAWRKTSMAGLRRNLTWPTAAALVVMIVLLAQGMREFYALICFSLFAFVVAGVLLEFYRGSRVRMSQLGESIVLAVYRLTAKNTRRYGGYIVHIGTALLFAGIAGTAFNSNVRTELLEGESIDIAGYNVRVDHIESDRTPNYEYERAQITLTEDGREIKKLYPERRFYFASEQASSEVEIHTTFSEDIYVVYASHGPNDGAVIQVYHNPLVRWLWVGGMILVGGTIITIFPNQKRREQIGA